MPRKKKEKIVKMYPQHEDTMIEVDGQKYKLKSWRMDKKKFHFIEGIFVAIDEEKYNKRMKDLAEKVFEKSKDKIKFQEVITDALKYQPLDKIEELEKKIEKTKTKVEVERGCIGIRIGGVLIDLKQ
jgi:hypothetical protein